MPSVTVYALCLAIIHACKAADKDAEMPTAALSAELPTAARAAEIPTAAQTTQHAKAAFQDKSCLQAVCFNCMSLLQAIYVPADDLTDPAPATTFAHLDATTVLSRSIAELGIYPAVDPLDSTSRMLSARILGQEHYDTARGVQRVLQVSAHAIDAIYFC